MNSLTASKTMSLLEKPPCWTEKKNKTKQVNKQDSERYGEKSKK